MSNGTGQSSLDSLAQIANMSHELHVLNQQIKAESASPPSSGNSNGNFSHTASQSNNGSPPPTLKSGKPKRMACVECRQQKSKCDAHERLPDPCTRCTKKGLKCDLKSDYKRTYKRARIAQIEKEFSELKRTLTTSQAAELLGKVPSLSQHPSMTGTPSQGSVQSPHLPIPQLIRRNQYYDGSNYSNSGYSSHQSPAVIHSMPAPIPPGHQYQDRPRPGHEGWIPSPYNHEQRFSHNSSDTNNSIPNTPSIFRQMEQNMSNNYPDYSKANEQKVMVSDYALVCEEKSIDTVSLSSETIRALYIEYVDHFHPILPVVDVSKGPERIYKLCPALFWVIMFVSLRRFSEDSHHTLLLQLSPIVKGILAEIMISPITRYNPTEEDEPILNASSVFSVQAFLLYSFWPPITSSLSADSSYTTVGTALFQAIRIGLHCPSSISVSDVQQKTPQQLSMAHEQAKTWIVCNVVSQTIATSFGFPAFVQFDSSIWNSIRPGSSVSIPRSIQLMMEIAHFEDQVAKTINSNTLDPYGLVDPTERLPLLKLLSRRLDEIEIRVSHELPVDDGFRRFQLLSARVHLLTYYFMDSSRIADFELQRGLVNLYNAATSLINLAQFFQSKDKKFVKYLPGVYVLNIWQAACIIGKLIHSQLKKVVDTGSGKQSYLAAISLAAKASILKHDMAHRSSGIMRNMWQLFRTLDDKKLSSLSITIRTRMSASVFFDCLHLLREQVGMIKLNSRTDSKGLEDEIDEDAEDAVSDEEEEEYGYTENNEEALVSDNESKGPEYGNGESQKSTPGSSTSSRTKKQRSLSNTVNAESKARKIIRTIPLDPQPISVSGKRSSIFKVVNASNDSSPYVRSDRGSPSSNSSFSQQNKSGPAESSAQNKPEFKNPGSPLTSRLNQQEVAKTPILPRVGHHSVHQQVRFGMNENKPPATQYNNEGDSGIANLPPNSSQQVEAIFNESPIQVGLENLEMDNFDMSSDLLWKDVDSVMNDFGFHTH
ncbi:uncharacterized protein RJT20DRAFT_125838 [Scheffersomyces xylosifermentans]|uniref:uncharacterized protein n=1 Tax=Scheffersomyces xylosifermentans TaxID=1304137 RepID=UPI00315DF18D